MSQRVSRILCAADPRGSTEAIEGLLGAADALDVQAVVIVGDLGGGSERAADLRTLLRALRTGDRPTFCVPGAGDAPIEDYLREAHNAEIVAPNLRGVHGTAALDPGQHILFAGIGGEIDDDPAAHRDEVERLHYPRWEPEYRLKLLREFPEHEVVLLFCTPPAHPQTTGGSDVVAELIATYRARLAVCTGEQAAFTLGRTMVVAPGSLQDGQYAVADLRAREVELGQMATAGRPAGA
jgi:Icc-related predicted phosphoesterase